MPELPDVERMRRFFERRASWKTIHRVVLSDPGIVRNVEPKELVGALEGRRFGKPRRLGKWLIAPTDSPTLLIHFGMTGDLLWGDDEWGRTVYDRATFVLEGGELRYRNVRKLGGLWLATRAEELQRLLGPLGPDAWGLGWERFSKRLRGRRAQLKAALMDQTILAGLGNVLVDEILWQAKLAPQRRVSELKGGELKRLFEKMETVLKKSVEAGMVPPRPDWLTGVRGKWKAGCPRCGRKLTRRPFGGRSSYYCGRCQAIDGARD